MSVDLAVEIGLDSCVFSAGDDRWVMDYGSQSVMDQHLESNPPRPEELSAALSVVELYVDDLKRSDFFKAVASTETMYFSGQALHLGAVEVGDGRAPADMAGYSIASDALEEVFRCLVTESSDQRIHNPGLLLSLIHISEPTRPY